MARIRKEARQQTGKTVWCMALYLRLSKEDGNDVSKSIKSQRMILENHIKGLEANNENIEIFDWYIDDGLSGAFDTRENFQRMLTDIERGKVNAVCVADLSRGFRNARDQQYYLESYFTEKNIRFISCDGPKIDTYYEPEKVLDLDVQFHGMMNAQYVKELSRKVKSRLKARRIQGEFVGSFAPYGYKKSKEDYHILVVDEDVAPVVKDIFKWFVQEGLSKRKICERLNDLGIPNPTAYKHLKGIKYFNPQSTNNSTLWNDSVIRNILKSQYYIGNLDQHHEETVFTSVSKNRKILDYEDYENQIAQNTHEAIIDKKTFELAQAIMQRDTRVSPKSNKLYLFSGLLKCADCNRSMVRTKTGNIIYYHCSTYRKRSKTHCSKHTIREDELINSVLASIQSQVALSVNIEEQMNKINKRNIINKTSQRIEDLLSAHYNDIKKEQQIIDSLYYDWKSGDITREQYLRVKESSEQRIQYLKDVIDKLIEEKELLESSISQNNSYLSKFATMRNVEKLDRALLIELIDTIYIYEGKKIEIVYTFQDEYRLTLEFIENNLNSETPLMLEIKKPKGE